MYATIYVAGYGRVLSLPQSMLSAIQAGEPVTLAGVAYEAVKAPGGDPSAEGAAAVTEDPPPPRRRRKGG